MIKLNLTANGNAEQRVKDYLEQNASETLAEKINNGVQIQKDNLTLLNKKDLTGFLQYSSDEAKKQAEQGARFACIDSQTVFAWAIHYFEEDSIEGRLYTLDGREYRPQVKKAATVSTPKIKTEKPATPQISLFDTVQREVKNPDTAVNDVWEDDSFDQAMRTVSPAPQAREQPKNDYPTILNQILDGKLEVTL